MRNGIAGIFAVVLIAASITPVEARPRATRHMGADATQIVSHPDGCPHRAFCGCGSWKYLTGQVVARGGPAKASWWFRFRPAQPGPGMAEVRRNHVRVIIQAHGDGTATFYDPNSGRHLTRIHRDRIRGRVVHPTGTAFASARATKEQR